MTAAARHKAADEASYDVVVVGSGVAGLATALGLAGLRRVALVTGGRLASGSTIWAQGGLAAAFGTDDSPALHALDTLTAGAGLGAEPATQLLAQTAPAIIAQLLRIGGRLDRDAQGELARTREGGHSRRRIVHAGGDASGAEVSRALVAAMKASDVDLVEDARVTDLLTVATSQGPVVTGLVAKRHDATVTMRSRAVVLATGGIGGLFATTTNPPEVTGAGLGLALRAGASLVDLEFVQFHPTALAVTTASGQVPLVSEALRGEGAVLRDQRGRQVMAGHHPLADLAPRDIVARRIAEVTDHGERVGLDTSAVSDLETRFPTVAAACRSHGIDPATDPIPVSPAQHFLCGGVRTDEWGATDVIGLYAVGEVAATGVHGANRLASNSLVEGLVFGQRVAARLALELPSATPGLGSATAVRPRVAADRLAELRGIVSTSAGIRRTEASLAGARDALQRLPGSNAPDEAGDELLAALAVVEAATTRRESRGCHWRTDHPAPSEWWRRRRVVVRLGSDGLPVASTTEPDDAAADLGRTA